MTSLQTISPFLGVRAPRRELHGIAAIVCFAIVTGRRQGCDELQTISTILVDTIFLESAWDVASVARSWFIADGPDHV